MQDQCAGRLGRRETEDLWRVLLNGGNRVQLSEEKGEPVVIQTEGFSDLTVPVQEAANAQDRVRLKGTRDAAVQPAGERPRDAFSRMAPDDGTGCCRLEQPPTAT